jgi:hypothetical protein
MSAQATDKRYLRIDVKENDQGFVITDDIQCSRNVTVTVALILIEAAKKGACESCLQHLMSAQEQLEKLAPPETFTVHELQ